jgi:hypothetical protein
MPTPELVRQVAEELKEIQNAPPIAYGPTVPTCHLTGRILKETKLIETLEVNNRVHQRFTGG